MLRIHLTFAAVCAVLPAQSLQPAFQGIYGYTDLGTIAGVPTPYGGLVFKFDDPDTLLIGGSANAAAGAIYSVPVVRDGTGRITGFGTPSTYATAPNIDGGLVYAPNNVLLYTAYPSNRVGQLMPGSTVADKLVDLTPLGVGASVGSITVTPPNFPGAGRLLIASYNANAAYSADLVADGNGTFDIANVGAAVALGGGPEGILHVPPGSSVFPDYQYALICEYGAGAISAYSLAANGDLVAGSRTPFMTQVGGAEGAAIDPITGDFFFSTFNGGNRVISVQGFGVCGEFETYGSGSPGVNGIPQIAGGGCAGRGQVANISVTNGPPGALGWINLGFSEVSIPVFNAWILCVPDNAFAHNLDATGSYTLPAALPASPIWAGFRACFQAGYLDAAAPFGFSSTAGLRMIIR